MQKFFFLPFVLGPKGQASILGPRLSNFGAGELQNGPKWDKNVKKSKNFQKFFFSSQNLIIWSGNSAEFSGLEAQKRNFFLPFVLGPKGQASILGPRLSKFSAGELQNEPKMLQNEPKM